MITAQVKSSWHYRHFIMSAIRSEMRLRFVNSRIGGLWFILHPLAMAAIYALILSQVLGAKIPNIESDLGYAVFLISGISAWSLFQEIANRCITVFLEYANAMKKINFPRSALPAIVTGSALISHGFLLIAALLVFIAFGHYPSWTWLALPLGLFVLVGFGLGLGLMLGVFNVFARDVQQVMAVIFNLWFWLTPIVYPKEIVPEQLQAIIDLNPMTPLVAYYQQAMLFRVWPDLTLLIYPGLLATGLTVISLFVFRRASKDIVDVL